MEISYDPAKNAANVARRGLSFDEAAHFDFRSALFWIDDRKDYGEVRISGLGYLHDRLHALVFVETADGIRVVSFRRANARERKRYEKATQS